jgi:hypothetical protein
MHHNTYIMMPTTLIDDLEETCERLERIRDQYLDMLHEAKASPKIAVKPHPREPLVTFPKAPTPEDLRKIF